MILNNFVKKYKPHEVDFVFPRENDTPVYLDLNLLYHSPEIRWQKVQSIIHEYFNHYLKSYREDNISTDALIRILMFREVKLIALGYCKKGKDGKGGARERAIAIKEAIFDDNSIKEIGIAAIAKMSIIIENVGPDTLSDMVANLGMKYLLEYTEEQVRIYNLKTVPVQIDRTLNIQTLEWEPLPKVSLPFFEGENNSYEPRILVPRHLVRKVPFFSPEGYYQNYLRYILKHEEEDRMSSVSAIGKKPKVFFKHILESLKSRFGKKIIAVRNIAKQRPETIVNYAEKPDLYKSKQRPKRKKENIDWDSYVSELESIPMGIDGAKLFSEFLRKIFTAIYEGHLTNGTLEERSEDGIFYYDITFGNGADTPLFRTIRNQQLRGGLLIIEAKNYESSALGNKEFNQSRAYTLADGRELVLLISRKKISERDIQRARRHFLAQRCLIFPLAAEDISELIKKRKKDKKFFDEFLIERLKKILQA